MMYLVGNTCSFYSAIQDDETEGTDKYRLFTFPYTIQGILALVCNISGRVVIDFSRSTIDLKSLVYFKSMAYEKHQNVAN